MYLFFDTETTGFPKKDVHARDPSQARVCQMALILTDDIGTVKSSLSALIKPDGWDSISEGAQEKHGITIDDCHAFGINAATAVDMFQDACQLAQHMVAHNLPFDRKMMGIECEAWGYDFPSVDFNTCTMKASKNICEIPGKKYAYKNPSLAEALKIICDKDIGDGAHDALTDTIACMDIFFELKNRGEI